MNSTGWIILLLVLGIFGFIIDFTHKVRITREEHSMPSTPTPTPMPKSPEPAPSPKRVQKYVSIYEYSSVRNTKNCGYCDGENVCDAKVCCVCGNDIDV